MQRLRIDQRFDRYTIVRLLGRGSSGESYEAEDRVLQRRVTLKIIHPWSPLSDAARRQFFRSMQGMSFITHTSLVPMLDYGEANRQLYIARQYSIAGSLLSNEGRQWYKPPLSIANAIAHMRRIAQGLHLLHSNGYAHGNITLANFLIAHAPSDDNQTSATPLLLADPGTTDLVRHFGQPQTSILPVTAAPEQARKLASAASDQYSLAIMLYFWLTGRFPYMGTEEEILQKKLDETFIPLTSLHATISLEQDRSIRRALSAYPEARYPSIMAFAKAIEAAFARVEAEPQISAITLDQEPQQPPEPLPPPGPDVPQPLPDPTPLPPLEPVPTPPETAPEPTIVPAPAPEGPIPPAPDIPQPMPQPTAPPQPITPQPSAIAQEITVPAHLLITSSHANASREIMLTQDTLTIGRAGSSAILLENDNQVSRHHALLRYEGDHYSICDQRSANGVYINGGRLADGMEHILVNGDHIAIGQYEIVFHDAVQKHAQEISQGAA